MLVATSVQFAVEGHLIAFTPLVLSNMGLSTNEVAVTGVRSWKVQPSFSVMVQSTALAPWFVTVTASQ